MKSVYKIFAVILAAGLTVMSCDKKPINEDIPVVNPEGGDETDPADGPRVITVSFNTKATRTVFVEDEDTLIPSFAEGDVIVVTDGKGIKEDCEVYFEGSYARIDIKNANLKDIAVIAVYPASAYIDSEPYFKVPSVQDGTFANANICKTKIAAGATAAVFENQTAVFVIELENLYSYDDYPDYGIGVNEVTISSLGKIEDGQRGTTKSPISSDTESEDKISIPLDTKKYHYCPLYISVLCDAKNPVLLTDLNFDINYDFYDNWDNDYYTTSPTSMGGFSPKFIKSINLDPETATVQAGAIYTGVEDHLHEYIFTPRDNTKPGSTDMKWALDDLSNGEYFMWGELSGHAWKNDSWTGFTNAYCFSSSNYTNPNNTTITANGVLSLEDDAAYYNWGGAWRMPTSGEWDRINGSSGISTLIPHLSRSDYASGNSKPSSSFYYYWSSTLNSPNVGNPIQVISYCYTINNEGFVTRINNDAQLIMPSSGIGMCIKAASPAF